MSTRKDALLIKTFALPAESGLAYSEVFDLFEAETKNDIHNIHAQFEVSLPALTLPSGASLVVYVVMSDSSALLSDNQLILQTTLTEGTYAAQKFQFKASEKPKRYWRAAVQLGGDCDLSAHTAEFAIVF